MGTVGGSVTGGAFGGGVAPAGALEVADAGCGAAATDVVPEGAGTISEGTGAAVVVVVVAGAGATVEVVDVGLGAAVVVIWLGVSVVVVVSLLVSATWCSCTAGRVGVWL